MSDSYIWTASFVAPPSDDLGEPANGPGCGAETVVEIVRCRKDFRADRGSCSPSDCGNQRRAWPRRCLSPGNRAALHAGCAPRRTEQRVSLRSMATTAALWSSAATWPGFFGGCTRGHVIGLGGVRRLVFAVVCAKRVCSLRVGRIAMRFGRRCTAGHDPRLSAYQAAPTNAHSGPCRLCPPRSECWIPRAHFGYGFGCRPMLARDCAQSGAA